MPYTPPAQRSPVASYASTPRSSFSCASSQQPHHQHQQQQQQQQQQTHLSTHYHPHHAHTVAARGASTTPTGYGRVHVPPPPPSPLHSPPHLTASSTSYLHKHRRTPSISKSTATLAAETQPLGSKSSSSAPTHTTTNASSAAAAAPPPPPDSPPGSTRSSSDEERTSGGSSTLQLRGRSLEDLTELKAAIRIIEQHRTSSPTPVEERWQARQALGLGHRPRIAPLPLGSAGPQVPLSDSARKISHSRSNTEGSAAFTDSKASSKTESSASGSDEDEGLTVKPSLIRKKSGELVRPALRPAARKRPSSMPGTPTYSKAVHFQDSSLEHVRHFLQVDRPIAVSAGSSPVETFDEDGEFPFAGDSDRLRQSPYDWEIQLTNFPTTQNPSGESLPVIRTERIYLSPDTRILMGDVVVKNLAFHKLVVARYTLDYWRTTSEVVAEYNSNSLRTTDLPEGHDRFTFIVKLDDQANLENKTMFFCLRYSVNGQEFWDNNKSMNYQIDFTKKHNSQAGNKKSTAGKSGASSGSRSRPRSMPSFDDFGGYLAPFEFTSFPQPNAMVGESPIRFRNRPSRDIFQDATGKSSQTRATGQQQAFGTRYDFGASLSAAIQAAGNSAPKAASALGNESPPLAKVEPVKTGQASDSVGSAAVATAGTASPAPAASTTARAAAHAALPAITTTKTKPVALTSEKPSLASSSYTELLDKYCFFGSARPSPPLSRGGGYNATTYSIPQQQPGNGQQTQQKSAIAQTDGGSDDADTVDSAAARLAKTGHQQSSVLLNRAPARNASTSPPSAHISSSSQRVRTQQQSSASANTSQRPSRSTSPATTTAAAATPAAAGNMPSSRSHSPGAAGFAAGYAHIQGMSTAAAGFFDTQHHAPTAIRG